MEKETTRIGLENLRQLAHSLDVRLGTETRKLILAGNERLTLATDAQSWTKWLSGVESRLQERVGAETAKSMLAESLILPGTLNAGKSRNL